MRKRLLGATALAVGAALALSGCSGGSVTGNSGGNGGKTTITVWHNYTGPQATEVKKLIDEYNASHYRVSFFYDLAKAAVNRMAFALAHELGPHGATALSLTPGWLRSEAMLQAYGVSEANWQEAAKKSPHFAISESPAFVGRAVVALATDPEVSRWNGKSLSSGELAKVYGFTDVDGSQPAPFRLSAST